jgi:uncharacterized membrane protein
MLNWRALGEIDQAASAKTWFNFSVGMLMVYMLMGVFMNDSKAADSAARGLGFLYLLIWYFAAGRAQGEYVKARFGTNYAKKSWGKTLLLGVVAFIGYIAVTLIVESLFGSAG